MKGGALSSPRFSLPVMANVRRHHHVMAIEALYKYGRLGEHTESLFATPTIWFSSPAALNDPFECRPWFTFDGTEQQFIDVFGTIARRHFPKDSPQEVKAKASRLYAQGKHKDQKFLETFRADVVRMFSNHIGLCCLSKSNTNILMWSHYAGDHLGFSLEFAASDHTPFFGEAQEVRYATGFPVVDFFNTPHDLQVDLIFLTKFVGWQYEEEYRIIDHQSGPGLHTYPVELLKSVTFGLRMPEPDKQKIRGWLGKRGTEVKLYQASIGQRDFKIVLSEVA
jgi:hypothetical protein